MGLALGFLLWPFEFPNPRDMYVTQFCVIATAKTWFYLTFSGGKKTNLKIPVGSFKNVLDPSVFWYNPSW